MGNSENLDANELIEVPLIFINIIIRDAVSYQSGYIVIKIFIRQLPDELDIKKIHINLLYQV